MDASLGDKDGTTGSKDLPSTQIDHQQQKELMDHFTKLHEAYAKKDYDAWLVIWPLFEKELRTFLETHVTTIELPKFDFFEGLPLNTDNTESGFNLEHLPLPTGDEWFAPDMDRILDEFSAGTMENDQILPLPANELPLLLPSPPANKPASPPPLADQALLPPPPAKKQTLPPPPLPANELPLPLPSPPANKPASPPLLADQALLPPPPPPSNNSSSPPQLADEASTKLTQAVTYAKDASILITKAAVNGSIGLNKDSVCHLESCETHISAAKASLRAALFHLSQARLVNQGESLSQLMKDD